MEGELVDVERCYTCAAFEGNQSEGSTQCVVCSVWLTDVIKPLLLPAR